MRGRLPLPFFYGWLLVAIGFVTMAVGVNARTAFSLLFPPILDEFGWDRGVTAGIFSFGFLVSALVTPFVGRLMDRRGPALVVELGVVAMAAGLLLAPLAREAWQLYLTLGAFVGGGINCLAYTGQSLYLTNWFVRRRGLAQHRLFWGRRRLGHLVAVVANADRGRWLAHCLLGARHSCPGLAGAAEPAFAAAARRYRAEPRRYRREQPDRQAARQHH
jgi:MFS family permease